MALVLGRDRGQAVRIGDDIRVQVVRGPDGEVRLAITAPRELRVMREELLTRIANDARGDTKPANESK